MPEYASLIVQLLTVAAASDSADRLTALVRGVAGDVAANSVDAQIVLAALSRRGDDASDALLVLAPHLRSTEEAILARWPDLPTAVVEHLAASKRKGTLMALAGRRDLPASIAESLATHRLADVRQQSLDLPNTPSRLRVEASRGGGPTNLDLWCDIDREFCKTYFRDQLAHARHPETSPRYTIDLDPMPTATLDDELLQLLTEVVSYDLDRDSPSSFDPVVLYLRKRPDAAAVLAVFSGLAPYLDQSAKAQRDIAYALSMPLAGSMGRGLGSVFPTTWIDPATVDAAWQLGGECRWSALASAALLPDLRNASVFSNSPAEWGAVACNPVLTSDEVDRLLDVLEPGARWRLAAAQLTGGQRRQILDGGPSVATLLVMATTADYPLYPWLQSWMEPELLRYMLARRDVCIDAPGAPGRFGQFANRTLALHPELAADVAAVIRTDDTLTTEMARAIFPHTLGQLSNAATDTMCALLPEWAHGFADLVSTANLLHTQPSVA